MLISKLKTENWLGLPAFAINFDPMTIIAGPNGSGKSSLLDAIRFALLGETPRGVQRKASYIKLSTHGAKDGSVSISVDGREIRRVIKTGDIGKVPVPALSELASWVLTHGAFMAKTEIERRKTLSELLQVRASPEAIAERLKAAGLSNTVAEDLKPHILKGFEAAEKHAQTRATESRGAWKALTGETYGDLKSEGWAPEPLEDVPTLETVVECETALTKVSAEIRGLDQSIGAASRAMSESDRARQSELAGKLPKLLESLTRGEAKELGLKEAVEQLAVHAAGNQGSTTPCPHCKKAVIIDRGNLKVPVEVDLVAMEQASRDLATTKAALTETQTQLTKLRENITAAKMSKALLENAGESVDVEALKTERDMKANREVSLRTMLATYKAKRADAEKLDGLASRARREHQLVQEFKKAADMLGPNGIPAMLIAQTLDPINNLLKEASDGAGWATIRIDAEMSLNLGDVPYALCSESECWRMDVAICYALGKLVNLPLLLIDRLDVLDMNSRGPALKWLYGLSKADWQVIVCATLKEVPKIPGIKSVWLDLKTNGRQIAA